MIEPRDAVVNVARSFRWVRETNGSNRGEVVDEMVRRTGLDPATRSPWRACFVAYCGYAAMRDRWPLKKVAGCVSLLYGKAFDGATRFKHTGFVVGMNANGGWDTIEGNTNEAGHPDGVGVFERVRQFGPSDRFIHWWEAPAATPRLAA